MKIARLTAILLGIFLFAALSSMSFAEGTNPQGTVGYTGVDVGEVIERLEKTSVAFANHFGDGLEESVLDATTIEGRLNEWAEDLEDSLDEMNDEFEDGNAVGAYLAKILGVAAKINGEMRLSEPDAEVVVDWANIRADLNTLARVYGQAPLRER